MKNVRKLLLIVSAVMIASVTSAECAFAETVYKKNSEIQEPVQYSIVNAIKNNNFSVLYNYNSGYLEREMKGDIDPLYLGEMEQTDIMSDDYTTYQILEYIQNINLSELGVNSTFDELASYLTVDKNAKNPEYWTCSTEWNYPGADMSKYKTITFNSWNKEAGKGVIMHFRLYKDDSKIELKSVILEKANELGTYLNNGETRKLFKELEEIKIKEDAAYGYNISNGNASNTSKTNINAPQWKSYDGVYYYWNGSSYVKGWQNIDGATYYFNDEGMMMSNTVVDGYYLKSNGVSTGTKDVDSNITAYLNDMSPEYRKEIYGNMSDYDLYQLLLSRYANYGTFELE